MLTWMTWTYGDELSVFREVLGPDFIDSKAHDQTIQVTQKYT
jgi:hypothetical protein